jgi:hypothetical protein
MATNAVRVARWGEVISKLSKTMSSGSGQRLVCQQWGLELCRAYKSSQLVTMVVVVLQASSLGVVPAQQGWLSGVI